MAAIFFCKHHLVRQRLSAGANLSLPALSFAALLTGFTFSLNLPSALRIILPAMESLLYLHLPHLWRGFLSWITPSCLFVLLNGIIMILTATSGLSSTSSSCKDASFSVITDDELDLKTENMASEQNAPCLEQSLEGPKEAARHALVDAAEDDALSEAFDEARGDDTSLALDVSQQNVSMPSMKYALGQQDSCESSSISSDSSFSFSSTSSLSSRSFTSPSSSDSSPSSFRSSSFTNDEACEEPATIESEPSSPQFLAFDSVTKGNNMRRSISIDSASFVSKREEPSDQLSEEAFRKRIEDFILKMNSKIRSETRNFG